MPFNSKIPNKIPSWVFVRELFRASNPAAMGQMRFLEKFAAMLKGAVGDTKPRKSEFESFAQDIWNIEKPLPFAERTYLRVAERILDTCQTYFQANRSVDTPDNRDYHMAELLCKYIIRFGVDGDVATIIESKHCTPLFNQLVRLMVVEAPSIDLKLPDFVIAYDLEKNGPQQEETETAALADVSDLLSAASVGPKITPAHDALAARTAVAQDALKKAIEEAQKVQAAQKAAADLAIPMVGIPGPGTPKFGS